MSTEEYPVWESMNQEMQSAIKSRETKALQQLLSRLSCKLRMSQHTFEFKTSQNIEIYLEPISSISKLPVEISFPEDTSNSPYRSLIMFTKGDQPQYLGKPIHQPGINGPKIRTKTYPDGLNFMFRCPSYRLRETGVQLRYQILFPKIKFSMFVKYRMCVDRTRKPNCL